ncbi:phage tail protein [Paraburkholderia sp. Ac-20347]|uniref:phage tail protein n=1 Tax=Paraburkholderia sp. Ac-20347 TaxID=2703892 RepID=UPI00197F564F|nr:phage tail protein [Paraburkholderia sp. Ac-20347]MBN3811705.1 phage tail protein [Paraburkholderia sp. Ac-20347]
MTVDIYHYYGSDLQVSPSGDLLVADQSTTGTQRVYRRLLTNPALSNTAGDPIASGDYTWHPDYGAGVPRKIGSPGNVPATKALIRGQMLLEQAVARSPAPVIGLTQQNDLVSATIQYTDANTATPQLLSFDLSQEP